ncbi:MAG TPA: hypothetical protein PK264_15950, partial [Hyphomicrobiaceae bacterium]|nr:hypothetical protein [Hyphomicrobiaceae bacterium]
LAAGGNAGAASYAVGPSRPYPTLQALLAGVTLQPGDLVEVDGNATYAGGVILRDSGSAALPVTIRGLRVNGQRPILSGGSNTIEFRQSNHVVFEGFEVTGGTSRCVFVPAAFITLRDLLVRRAFVGQLNLRGSGCSRSGAAWVAVRCSDGPGRAGGNHGGRGRAHLSELQISDKVARLRRTSVCLLSASGTCADHRRSSHRMPRCCVRHRVACPEW